MRVLFVLATVFAAIPAAAQLTSRPTDPPLVSAVAESWYQLREPLAFAGEVYYPSGPIQFFNGDTMVRSGHYNGVPLYVDATVEPYRVVLVPIGGKLLRPYERRRQSDLAGTSGGRAPTFPEAQVSPTGLPQPAGAVNAFTAETGGGQTTAASAPAGARAPVTSEVVGTSGFLPTATRRTAAFVSLRRPESNDGVWINYAGVRYVSAGAPVAFQSMAFAYVGEYAGLPVFGRAGQPDRIYLPTSRAGIVAPYRLKE